MKETPTTDELEQEAELEEKSPLELWTESVGRVFKLITKSYGIRNVTYTQIKGVKEAETPGQFDIEVACAEFTARVLDAKRAHSSGCKEGVIHQDEESILLPSSFGEECGLEEFDKVTAAILAHATANLDLVLQHNVEEKTEIDIPIDLPHLKVTELEASLLRNSPFLVRNVYLLTANSVRAAFESINRELQRATKNSRLTDTCDPVYVSQKNDVIISLRNKLNHPIPETGAVAVTRPAEEPKRFTLKPKKETLPPPPPAAPVAPPKQEARIEPEPEEAKAAGSPNRRLGLTAIEKKNSIALALRGKSSAANLFWEIQNPSKEGPVFRIGKTCGLLDFTQWAHLSGRAVSPQEVGGKKLRSYFGGPDLSYTGPDKDGFYPQLKLQAETPVRAASAA